MRTETQLANIDVLDDALFIEFQPHESLFLSDDLKMLEFWEVLTPLIRERKNTMIFAGPRDFLAPIGLNRYFESSRASGNTSISDAARNSLVRWLRFIHASNLITISILEGAVDFDLLGLPLVCTYRLYTPGTIFVNATMKRDCPPAGAAPWLLASQLGANRMKKFYLENTTLSAEDALNCGNVDGIHTKGGAFDEALSLARRFASLDRRAVRSLFKVADETDLDLSSYQKKYGVGF